jgi:HPr kinase/phosphorylase
MSNQKGVLLTELIREFDLEVLNKGARYKEMRVTVPSVNRPGLQLVDFYDYFDHNRVQLLGKAEYSYMRTMTPGERYNFFDSLFARPIPALIIARSLAPYTECVQAAEHKSTTLLRTDQVTGEFMSELTASLRNHLSPRITRHGVLMEIYGEGVLLMGESGVGKSETAIDLIKRGHRLIADDMVDMRRLDQDTLMGTAPDLIRYYMEVRGIGIVDVRRMFGVSAVKHSQKIDMIVNLEHWKEGSTYDRLGLEEQYTELLDVKVPTVSIPVMSGRNLSIIIEVAAMNNRQKKMGFNSALEFTQQIDAHFAQASQDMPPEE